jgi:uncharacterized membrane protein YhiD involved in acid resistance
MINSLTGFFNNGIVTIILLLIIFSLIALLASWLRKLLMPSKDEGKVDPKRAVKEELDRVLVPLETPLTPSKKVKNTSSETTRKTTSSKKTSKSTSASTNARKRKKAS